MKYSIPTPEFEDIQDLEQKLKVVEGGGLCKEILLLKEVDLPLVGYYLKTLYPKDTQFVYHTGVAYNKISKMMPNLLREEYWVIANHGKVTGIKPPKLDYNEEVLNKYLNHIIVSSNFSILNDVNKEDFTVPIKFGNSIYKYKVKFVSTLPKEVLVDYITNKLEIFYDLVDLNRIIDFIVGIKYNRKNIVKFVERFALRYKYPLDVTLNELRTDVNYKINKLVKSLLLKLNDSNWQDIVKEILTEYGEPYLDTVLNNQIDLALKLKYRQALPEKDKYKTKYMGYYIKEVDLLNLMYLQNVLNKKEDFRIKMFKIENYMNKDMKELLVNYRGGL